LIKKVLASVDLPIIPESWEAKADDVIIRGLLKSRIYRHVFSFEEAGGLYSADAFVEWLIEKLDADGRAYSGKTLAQFHEATGRHFTVIAADTSEGQMLILNHNTAPDLPVVMAVRMSMSVPLLWQEVIWQAGWGTYRGDDIAGHAIVDGGVVSNFPIELFLSTSPHVMALMGEPSDDVMGFLLDEKKVVPNAPDKPGSNIKESNIDLGNVASVRRIAGLANTMSQAHDKLVMRDYKQKVVRLPAKGYGTTEFDMTDGRREALIQAGYDVTKAHLEGGVFETGIMDQEAIDDVAESILAP
jgi:predicted acylesterase/phospholipase RssA